MSVLTELKSRFRTALAALVDSPDEYLDQVRPHRIQNSAITRPTWPCVAKKLKRQPRNLAAEIIAD